VFSYFLRLLRNKVKIAGMTINFQLLVVLLHND
jgi:hypothetical protein